VRSGARPRRNRGLDTDRHQALRSSDAAGERELQPDRVDRELPRREPAQPGLFRDPDPIFDAGVDAVTSILTSGLSCDTLVPITLPLASPSTSPSMSSSSYLL